VPEVESNTTEGTLATEREQFAYDQSLANDENVGMVTTMLANIVLLTVIVLAIMFSLNRRKKRQVR